MAFELVDVEPEVLERDDAPGVDEAGIAPGLGHGGDVERAALGADLELLLEVADRLDLDLVVGLGVDQLVEDRPGRPRPPRARRRSQVDRAGVLAARSPPPCSSVASPSLVVVVVVAARGERQHDDGEQRNRIVSLRRRDRIVISLRVVVRLCRRSAVDAGPVVGVEEVQAVGVDDELDRLALAAPWCAG